MLSGERCAPGRVAAVLLGWPAVRLAMHKVVPNFLQAEKKREVAFGLCGQEFQRQSREIGVQLNRSQQQPSDQLEHRLDDHTYDDSQHRAQSCHTHVPRSVTAIV